MGTNNDDDKKDDDPIRNPGKYGQGTVTIEFQRSVRKGPGEWDFGPIAAHFRAGLDKPGEHPKKPEGIDGQTYRTIVRRLFGISSSPGSAVVQSGHSYVSAEERKGFFEIARQRINVNGFVFDFTDGDEDDSIKQETHDFLLPLEEMVLSVPGAHIAGRMYYRHATLTVNEMCDELVVPTFAYTEIETRHGQRSVLVVPLHDVYKRALYQIRSSTATTDEVKGTGIVYPSDSGKMEVIEIMKYGERRVKK